MISRIKLLSIVGGCNKRELDDWIPLRSARPSKDNVKNCKREEFEQYLFSEKSEVLKSDQKVSIIYYCWVKKKLIVVS
jgi:hypothetical protein